MPLPPQPSESALARALMDSAPFVCPACGPQAADVVVLQLIHSRMALEYGDEPEWPGVRSGNGYLNMGCFVPKSQSGWEYLMCSACGCLVKPGGGWAEVPEEMAELRWEVASPDDPPNWVDVAHEEGGLWITELQLVRVAPLAEVRGWAADVGPDEIEDAIGEWMDSAEEQIEFLADLHTGSMTGALGFKAVVKQMVEDSDWTSSVSSTTHLGFIPVRVSGELQDIERRFGGPAKGS